jgi:hypothetical protein
MYRQVHQPTLYLVNWFVGQWLLNRLVPVNNKKEEATGKTYYIWNLKGGSLFKERLTLIMELNILIFKVSPSPIGE